MEGRRLQNPSAKVPHKRNSPGDNLAGSFIPASRMKRYVAYGMGSTFLSVEEQYLLDVMMEI